jgi:hypothetical protein
MYGTKYLPENSIMAPELVAENPTTSNMTMDPSVSRTLKTSIDVLWLTCHVVRSDKLVPCGSRTITPFNAPSNHCRCFSSPTSDSGRFPRLWSLVASYTVRGVLVLLMWLASWLVSNLLSQIILPCCSPACDLYVASCPLPISCSSYAISKLHHFFRPKPHSFAPSSPSCPMYTVVSASILSYSTLTVGLFLLLGFAEVRRRKGRMSGFQGTSDLTDKPGTSPSTTLLGTTPSKKETVEGGLDLYTLPPPPGAVHSEGALLAEIVKSSLTSGELVAMIQARAGRAEHGDDHSCPSEHPWRSRSSSSASESRLDGKVPDMTRPDIDSTEWYFDSDLGGVWRRRSLTFVGA